MAITMLGGESVDLDIPDVSANNWGEYPLPDSHLERLKDMPLLFKDRLGMDDNSTAVEAEIPERHKNKTVKLTFNEREDAWVYAVCLESGKRLKFEPVMVPNQAISLVVYKDGSPMRAKMHYYKDKGHLRESALAHRPSEGHINLFVDLVSNAPSQTAALVERNTILS
jgi:hypothetical protein